MEENGQLRVDQFLRVDGCEDIYAIGDCCNTKDFKLAYAAGEQAKRVVSNLVQRANGKAEQPWVEGEHLCTSFYTLLEFSRFLSPATRVP